VSASLETFNDFCIGFFHQIVALWVSNGRISNLDAKIFAVPMECIIGELGPVMSDDPVWDPDPVDNRLDEIDYKLFVDFDHRGRFQPLGEFVDADVEIPVPFVSPGKWPQDV
jgi:hypothetical protein